MFDVNISYGNWPFQNFSELTPEKLILNLKKHGINRGLISSLDTVFQSDLDFFNRELINQFKFCSEDFMPVITVNPEFANAFELMDKLQPKIIKLIPNYHSYSLHKTSVDQLAEYCIKKHITVIIQRRIFDERAHQACCKVPGVPIEDIADFADRYHKLKILCLNVYHHEAEKLIGKRKNIFIEISSIETLNTVNSLLKIVPANQILFGSNTPFFYTRAAVMKIEAADISPETLKQITEQNIKQLEI